MKNFSRLMLVLIVFCGMVFFSRAQQISNNPIQLYGTNAQRLAYQTINLPVGANWLTSDTLTNYQWNGLSWVPGTNVAYTNTPTNSPTVTPTNTPTNTPPSTPTNTPTVTPSFTPTNTPTNTPTLTPDATKIIPYRDPSNPNSWWSSLFSFDASNNMNAGNQAITNLLDPTTAQMGATKNYVDTHPGNIASGFVTLANAETPVALSVTGLSATSKMCVTERDNGSFAGLVANTFAVTCYSNGASVVGSQTGAVTAQWIAVP